VAFAVWTALNGWGAGIALHYLSRVYWPDPADPIPPPPESNLSPMKRSIQAKEDGRQATAESKMMSRTITSLKQPG
jgi:hypothetical protein